MSLSPNAFKEGECVPPLVKEGDYGWVKVRVEKLLWNLPRSDQPLGVKVVGAWWGTDAQKVALAGGADFNVATSLQRTLATTVTHKVRCSLDAFTQYVGDMTRIGGGYKVILLIPEKRPRQVSFSPQRNQYKAFAEASIDFASLSHHKSVQGFFSVYDPSGTEVARIKLKAWGQISQTDQSPPSTRGAPTPSPLPPPPPAPAPAPPIEIQREPEEPSPHGEPRMPSISTGSVAPSVVPSVIPSGMPSAIPSVGGDIVRSQPSSHTSRPQSDSLDHVYERALHVRQALQRTLDSNSVDTYGASLQEGVGIGVPAATPSEAYPALPPPIYVPHILEGEVSSCEEESSYEELPVEPPIRHTVPHTIPQRETTLREESVVVDQTVPLGDDVGGCLYGGAKILTVYLGEMRLLRENDIRMAGKIRVRILASEGLVYGGVARKRVEDSCVLVPKLPFVAPLIGEGRDGGRVWGGHEDCHADVFCCGVLACPRDAHVVLEFTLLSTGGFETCLGVLDFAAPSFLSYPPDTAPQLSVVDPLTSTPSMYTRSCVAFLDPSEATVPCRLERPGAAEQQSPAGGNVAEDVQVRTVEVVHTYRGSDPTPQAITAATSPLAISSHHHNHHHHHPREHYIFSHLACTTLPLIEVEGGAPQAPSCYITVETTTSSETPVSSGSCNPSWLGQYVVPAEGGVVRFALWVLTEGRPQRIAGATVEMAGLGVSGTHRVALGTSDGCYVRQDGGDGIGFLSFVYSRVGDATALQLPSVPQSGASPHSIGISHSPPVSPQGVCPRGGGGGGGGERELDSTLGLPALQLQIDALMSGLQKRLEELPQP